jgi:hypothetical protein
MEIIEKPNKNKFGNRIKTSITARDEEYISN